MEDKASLQAFWVKDEFVLRCTACEADFSALSKRRHHCRDCGEVFCDTCTQKRLQLPGYDSPQRICESCFTQRTVGINLDESTVDGRVLLALKRLYRAGIKPLERLFRFQDFYSPHLTDADFNQKPMVLLVGQYSVGKTSFIRHMLGRDYPNARVGPEPTTERFTLVTASATGQDNVIPGNALAVQSDRPFRSLQKFGGAFLTKFECAECALPPLTPENEPKEGDSVKKRTANGSLLRHISFVDTPGILSGEKQRLGRSYDFTGVIEWFAGRCDRILLLFDAHKLDISDEFQKSIEALRAHDEKIRVVLNKADAVDAQQLMRVHGALMWSLGKVIRTPEVLRVYVGSFWDEPVRHQEFAELFRKEEEDLISDLESLKQSAVVRKINEVVKRARAARVHALIIDHIRSQLPSFFGRERALQQILANLGPEFKTISRAHGIPLGDFPHPDSFKRLFETHCGNSIDAFPPLNPQLLSELTEILQTQIPRIVASHNEQQVTTVVKTKEETDNPFSMLDWQIPQDRFDEYKREFEDINPDSIHGLLSGAEARPVLMASGLPQVVLKKVWALADHDKDGRLTVYEFALAKHLIESALRGNSLPDVLPPGLVPPKRPGS